MKLECSVLVVPFTSASLAARQRSSKGILILRYGKGRKIGECDLVFASPQNRNGRLFHVGLLPLFFFDLFESHFSRFIEFVGGITHHISECENNVTHCFSKL